MDMQQYIRELTPLSQKQLIALAVKQNEQLNKLNQAINSPATDSQTREDIAIIGLHCMTPQADDNTRFWETLMTKEDVFKDARKARFSDLGVQLDHHSHSERAYCYQAGLINGVDQFDPAFFGISPREARGMDPQQRLLLKSSVCALANAGYPWKSMNNTNTGVFVGVGASEYHLYHDALNPAEEASHMASGNSIAVIAGRIAYTLGLRGPTLALDTACSSSMVALHLALESLHSGECDQAIVGGVNLILSPSTYLLLCKSQMLSPDGLCKTFDQDANGYVRSEAVISLIIKPLAKALADGDHVMAKIKGSAMNQDGRSAGLTVPSASAQQQVIEMALQRAGLSTQDIDYVECHGTGTALGDPIEVQTIAQTFKLQQREPLILGAIKSTIGHTEAAGGLAGLAKAVLAMEHNCIPPQANFSQWNPKIHVDPAQLLIPTSPLAWNPRSERKRRCGISSFGFSGTNAHVVIEEPDNQVTAHKQPLPTPEFNEQRIWWSHPVDPITKSTNPAAASQQTAQLTQPRVEADQQAQSINDVVCQVIATICGIAASQVNKRFSLREHYGFDSIMTSQLHQQLNKRLTHPSLTRVPLQILVDNDGVADLIAGLEAAQFVPNDAPVAMAKDEPTAESSQLDSRVTAYIEQRSKTFDAYVPRRIDRTLVHKAKWENVLVADVKALGENAFVAEMTQDSQHDYFYEHYLDHVPGLYVVEAVRQAATAISHLFKNIDNNHTFVLNNMNVSFSHFIETNEPAFIYITFTDQTLRDGRVKFLAVDARVIHQGREVAKITGQGDISTRNEYHQYRGDALKAAATHATIACFDLDGTLTHSHTFWRFLKRCAGRTRFTRAVVQTLPLLPQVYRGKKTWLQARERLIELCLKDITADKVEQVANSFTDQIQQHMLRDQALSTLRKHQQLGHKTYIISNSAENYLHHLAERLGMDGVCGSQFEVVNGRLTGRLVGDHCQGVEKVKRISGLVGDRQATQIYAYGDSRGDKAMLDWADYSYFKTF